MSGIEQKEKSSRKTRFRISLRITVLVVAIFIIASLVCLFAFQNALNDMAENSKEKIVDSVAKMVSSSHSSVTALIINIELLRGLAGNYQQVKEEFSQGLASGSVTPPQKYANELLEAMHQSGFLGFDATYFALPASAENNGKAIVAASCEAKYISKPVPDDVAALINSKKNYRLFENGIPEMGLKGPYLVTSYRIAGEGSSGDILWYFDFKPMGKLLSGIDSFYQSENRNAVLALCLVIILSIIGIIIISFLVLGYLIKKRISGPIDELSSAAEKVIEGDMDVRLEIKKREEFSALKSAFNQMIATLSEILTRASGSREEGDSREKPVDGDGDVKTHLTPRSTILFQVIALFTVIFITAGAFFMLSIGWSMNSLVKKSKDTLIDTEGKLVLSGHEFGHSLEQIMTTATGRPAYTGNYVKDFFTAVSNRTISPYQEYLSGLMRDMVTNKLFDYALVYCIFPPGTLSNDYLVVISSDNKFMYTKPPEEVLKFFDKGKDTYIFYKDGLPALGIDEPVLATCFTVTLLAMGGKAPIIIDFKPMGREIEAVDSFFSHEKNDLIVTMGIVIGSSILLLIIITALALSYLIRKSITGPIDQLVTVVNKAVQGDLDVRVHVRPGEDFESLKIAFNEMIKALSDVLERSVRG